MLDGKHDGYDGRRRRNEPGHDAGGSWRSNVISEKNSMVVIFNLECEMFLSHPSS